jgi:hypothetical protein
MRFPVRTDRVTCPGCGKRGKRGMSGTHPAQASRPTVSLYCASLARERDPDPVDVSLSLGIGWEPGKGSAVPRGVALWLAREAVSVGDIEGMRLDFCSTACLRRFFEACVSELEQRIARAEAKQAKTSAAADPACDSTSGTS